MIGRAAAAIRAGELVVLPTDTVYGLCSAPGEDDVRRLYELKGRARGQPTAILFSDVRTLLENLPDIGAPAARVVGVLLPGPYTLVLPNPGRRFSWLNPSSPEKIGVRVPRLGPAGVDVLQRVGCLVATSANLPGGADPRRLEDVPAEIRAGCAVVVDGGELPGVPSTVIDLSAGDPVVLREGAVAADVALELVRADIGHGE